MFKWKQHLSTIDALVTELNFILILEDVMNNRVKTLTKYYNSIMWVINFQIFKRGNLMYKFCVFIGRGICVFRIG
jgi:hypothetical protein